MTFLYLYLVSVVVVWAVCMVGALHSEHDRVILWTTVGTAVYPLLVLHFIYLRVRRRWKTNSQSWSGNAS